MESPPANKQRRKPALDLENLLQKLLAIDESSLTELQEFKRALQQQITPPDIFSRIVPTLVAGKLTRPEVFTYFGLRNKRSEKWGIVAYDIPTFELPRDFENIF